MRTLIALMLTLLLCGCAATAMVNVQSEPAAEDVEPQAELAAEEQINYTVELSTWTDTAVAEDGTELAVYRFDLPVLAPVHQGA